MKNNTIYIFIISLLFLMASGALIFYTHSGIYSKIEIVKAYYAKQKKEQMLQPTIKVKASLESLSYQEQLIKKTFLSSTAMVDFITKLESLAQTNSLNISVQKIEYGTSEVLEEKYTMQSVSFALELQGNFNDINSFVTQLTTSKEVLVIKEFKLYKIGDMGSNTYTARIIIEGKTLTI